MQHLDEHTLELFVLGDPAILKRRRAIEAHLTSCRGCRQLVEKMQTVYREAEREILQESAARAASRSLIKKAVHLSNIYHESTRSIVPEPRGFVGRAWWYASRHPVSSGAGLTVLAVALVAFLLNGGSIFKDTNPVHARFNSESGRLGVFNKEGEQLWSLPWHGEHDFPANDLLTIVTDLDDDGRNELITMRSSLGTAEESRDILKVFDSQGNLKLKKKLGRPFTALGKTYDVDFSPKWMIVENTMNGGHKEIFVGLSHVHSPFMVLRLTSQGEEIGEYWHFGHLSSFKSLGFTGGRDKEIVLGGSLDIQPGSTTGKAEENIDEWHAVFTILDPKRIVGKTQSSVTPVFELAVTEAEQFYLTLPRTELNRMFSQKPKVGAIEFPDPMHLTVWSTGGDPPYDEYGSSFEYVFGNDLRVIDVKPADVTRRLYQRLFREGKLKKRLDSAYLEALKQGVRYWDGKGWRKEVVGVGIKPLAD